MVEGLFGVHKGFESEKGTDPRLGHDEIRLVS